MLMAAVMTNPENRSVIRREIRTPASERNTKWCPGQYHARPLSSMTLSPKAASYPPEIVRRIDPPQLLFAGHPVAAQGLAPRATRSGKTCAPEILDSLRRYPIQHAHLESEDSSVHPGSRYFARPWFLDEALGCVRCSSTSATPLWLVSSRLIQRHSGFGSNRSHGKPTSDRAELCSGCPRTRRRTGRRRNERHVEFRRQFQGCCVSQEYLTLTPKASPSPRYSTIRAPAWCRLMTMFTTP